MRDIRDSPNAMSGPKARPGLSREIQDLVQQCRVCTLHKENKPKLLIATPLPDRPWQVVATDLFELKGIDYLIVIDYFSRCIEVAASTIRRNRVHLTSLPDQLENEQLKPEEKQVPAESKAATPIRKDVPVSKRLSSTPRNTYSCY